MKSSETIVGQGPDNMSVLSATDPMPKVRGNGNAAAFEGPRPYQPRKSDQVRPNGDTRGKVIEDLATRMRAPGNVETFAIDYSVLRDETQRDNFEGIKWYYVLAWPLMTAFALYMAVKVLIFRIRNNGRVDKMRLLLGPKIGTLWFDKYDYLANLIRNGVTTSIALDVVYNYRTIRPMHKGFFQHLANFLINQPDGVGLRNRLRVVYKKILRELEHQSRHGTRDIKVLSLACGSAQAMIEALKDFSEAYPTCGVEVTLIDLNTDSLNMAEHLAQSRGVSGNIKIVVQNIKDFLDKVPDESHDHVEMVGFLDYRNEKSIIDISKKIRRVLKPGGSYITACVAPSIWSFNVRWIPNWPLLIRRSLPEFRGLVMEANFDSKRSTFEYVETKKHVVGVCVR